MKNCIPLLFLLLCFAGLQAQPAAELVVFVQNEQKASEHFKTKILDSLRNYVRTKNMIVKVVDARHAVPQEIRFTPQIVFQNALGRSFYRGRYLTYDRLYNFIRTVQNAPQQQTPNVKQQIAVLTEERTTVGSPIKVTALQGDLPEHFDPSQFEQEAKAALAQGYQQFRWVEEYTLDANVRLFYQDYHPYRDEQGRLYVSASVYSMFSCIEPVFSTEEPWVGKWEDREALFQEIGKQMEQIVLRQMQRLDHGDAIEILPNTVPNTSWENLGLQLPKGNSAEMTHHFKLENLSTTWEFDTALADGSPLVQFHFGAPVDHYAGEVRELKTQWQLNQSGSLKGATGFVLVNTSSITMGDAGLDDHIFNDYLKVLDFPNASFEFEVTDAPEVWAATIAQNITLTGAFEMVGKKVELEASGRIGLIAGDDGTPRLKVHGKFTLPLKRLFGIDGPDGPSPAKDELQFYVNFLLKPAGQVQHKGAQLFEAQTVQEEQPAAEDGMLEDHIQWTARNKIYKANGSFKQWEITQFQMNDNDVQSLEVTLQIDMNSLQEKSKLLVKHLKSEDFFDVEAHPCGSITLKNPVGIGEDRYKAAGVATLLGITDTVPVEFEVISYSPFTVKGNGWLNRNTFGIGKSKRSKGITEEVQIHFMLTYDEMVAN